MDRGINEERLSRLPVWARDEIERLNRRVGELRQEVLLVNGELGDTNTFADPHRSLVSRDLGPHDRGLPLRRNEQVRFYLGEDGLSDRYIDVRVEDGRLWVHGSTGFEMTIRGSNTVSLRCIR